MSIFVLFTMGLHDLTFKECQLDDRHYVFIINPVSGTKNKKQVERLIRDFFAGQSHEIFHTEAHGHASVLAARFADRENCTVVAVGGDGTINEVARSMMGRKAWMGIIPTGSGNGFAGHALRAGKLPGYLEILQNARVACCDVLMVNGQVCCNTAGFGLSGFVAKIFNEEGKRGLFNYLRLGLREFRHIREFEVSFDGKKFDSLINVELANSSQLGNNAYVSPDSSIQDGIAEIVFLRKPPLLRVPGIIYHLFAAKIHSNSSVQVLSASSGRLLAAEPDHFHIDGEYRGKTDQLDFHVMRDAIKLLI